MTDNNNNCFAIISDIHSNLEALQTVLDDIDKRGIKEIICLGDLTGYGANPAECLDLIMARCRLTLMGNHDHACMFEPTNFNLPAERACYWTRQVLEDEPDVELRNERWKFLGELPVRAKPTSCRHCPWSVYAILSPPILATTRSSDLTRAVKYRVVFGSTGTSCHRVKTRRPGVWIF